jgi:hypothetical protein
VGVRRRIRREGRSGKGRGRRKRWRRRRPRRRQLARHGRWRTTSSPRTRPQGARTRMPSSSTTKRRTAACSSRSVGHAIPTSSKTSGFPPSRCSRLPKNPVFVLTVHHFVNPKFDATQFLQRTRFRGLS